MKKLSEIWEAGRRVWRNTREKSYTIAVLAGFFWIGLLGTYLVWLNGRLIPGIRIAGIKAGGFKVADVAGLLEARILPGQQRKITLGYQNRNFDVVIGAIGIEPDIATTVRLAYHEGRLGSFRRRFLSMVKARRYGLEVGLRFRHNPQILDSFYRMLDASIGREPVRAVVRVGADGRVRYTPSQEGRLIDRKKLTRLFETAVAQPGMTRIEIPVKRVIPTLSSADIKKWRFDQVVGMYVTAFNPQAAERTHNIRTACSALDNVMIYPGQNFSFNTWIGPRMAGRGYKEAPVVFKGKLVPGIGGGVCQVSTTLYNAVLLANLKVVKRFNHSIPSAYVPLGRDATVVNGGLDFIFTNSLAYPILLTAEVDPPHVRVAVLGEKGNWDRVTLETELVESYPYEVKEIPDPELEWGERVQQQSGKEGCKVRLWRTVNYLEGVVKRSLVSASVYPAQPEEVKVGTKMP